ncbi:aquaporin [Mangrovibrevibacter kandeliae]|uniref:aquaporin n=1 Tax=Mangrovibrevibacter kandeliae TaxID=2968473 RepID=UPI002119AEC7|nr:MIP/aquaporin family protein [Aurantimonas sp. CSK15Z-1]MCQ8780589.1 aquaporin family protein [Aurantimonas sp. CSK15Z-1]
MSAFSPARRVAAEFLGTALLVAAVVGSGIMADRLTADGAIALLGNALATGAIVVCLITVFGPISGAHFNPAVTLVVLGRGSISARMAGAYLGAQVVGGVAGTLLAHAMFELSLVQLSTTIRTGGAQWLAEAVATFGLLAVILGGIRFNPVAIPWLVGLYITAAYWWTASTSFANPAVALARSLTDTFSGIRPADVPGFVLAELAGATAAATLFGWLLAPDRSGLRQALPAPAADTSTA